MEQMDLTISDSAEASKSPSFLRSKWHKSKPKTPLNVRNSQQQTDRSARGTMFKLGIAFVAVALFVCSCYAELLTEELNSPADGPSCHQLDSEKIGLMKGAVTHSILP